MGMPKTRGCPKRCDSGTSTVELWSIPESRGMGKEPRPDHSGRGTGSVALREGDRKCWIALSFPRKSTRAPVCRRRPFDRLEIIIGQRSLARMDKHERKNMHVILKLLYKSDPSALACVFTYRNHHLSCFILVDLSGRFYVRWTRVRMKITDHSSKSGWLTWTS